ncbi:4-hydroxy-2-oxoheptanedioate aldolase [Conservatibacter flavescens]|uniref:4-hydroxy-2-oxoheptanedioate aldolase n=1 Tax=Conservatibacter flavescens TaxID=28161 RepID=A0A2M8S1T6_9PAST|nr:4-hydroxy-2-oxoheptanedioate aldolase [Conservatibacter flavescens]PJG85078.1 4-hydroxy-2-oxoheptanedioate aldolase [Conservatibacter flavescens]
MKNIFKQHIQAKQAQIGLWLGLASGYSCELAANAGFDWLLLDAEHAPNDLQSLLHQLHTLAAYPVSPIVRPPIGENYMIKQLLDIGAQTLLIPMVESAAQARELVKAIHYPPKGVRGVGSALARASRWNTIPNYLQRADDEICLLVQVETKKGLDNLNEIVAVEGVDGVFIGPADLSASLGHLGNPSHPDVQYAIEQAIHTINQANKAAGILYADETLAKHYLQLGCLFVAVGVDTSLLMQSLKNLAQKYKNSDNINISPNANQIY